MTFERGDVAQKIRFVRLALCVFAFVCLDMQGQLFIAGDTYAQGGGPAGPDSTFVIMVIPDTQEMFSTGHGNNGTPQMAYDMFDWIVTQQPDFIIHVGDIVDSGCSDINGWLRADTAFQKIKNADLPFAAIPGNHDIYGCANGDSSFNQILGPGDFVGKPYYGGHIDEPDAFAGTENNTNNFSFFNTQYGQQFIVIGIQENPTATQMHWADSLLVAHPNHTGIVFTHDVLFKVGTTEPNGWSSQGIVLYDTLKSNRNLDFIFAGHYDHRARRQDTFLGATITSIQINWQSDVLGGSGFVGIATFDARQNFVRITGYSAFLDSTIGNENEGTESVMPPGTFTGPDVYQLTWVPKKGHLPDLPSSAGDTTNPPGISALNSWPNPFNPYTTISFVVNAPDEVTLDVFDVRGHRLTTLVKKTMVAGPHEIRWDGTDESGISLSSGVYFARLRSGRDTRTLRMVLLK
ncbi:MAG: metallophosphoesterase [Candidatus Krumholzibacteriota bacterium]|nr:metallophosphoesterase [Candidatus Krumholzibacteriota bacterium]